MRSILTLSLVSCTAWLTAQQCAWLTSAPVDYTMNPSMANEVLASAPGRLVSGRQITGVFVYGQTVYGRAIVESLDLDGLPIWSCLLDDSVTIDAAVVAEDGRAYFAGRFMGGLQLCNGEVVAGLPDHGMWTENLFMVAVDLEDGHLEWARNLSLDHQQASSVASLALDPQGRLWYAIGEWGLGKVVRVDEQGADVEVRSIEGVRVMGTMSFDPWGGLYLSGSCDNNGLSFAGQPFTDPGTSGYSMFVLRYNGNGTAGFARFAEDITFQDPTVVATRDGHAYLAGNLFEGTHWGSVGFHGPDWTGEVFLARLDSLGEFLWGVESAPAPGGTIVGGMTRAKGPCIALDEDDVVHLIGNVRGITDWGNGVVSGAGQPTDQRLCVIAFADDGTASWSADSEEQEGFTEARTVTATAEPGAVHFAAHARDQFTFGSHTTNATNVQAAVFGELNDLPTNVPARALKGHPSIFPNPVQDGSSIRLTGVIGAVSIFNTTGQRVADLRSVNGIMQYDVSGLAPGIYTVRTNDNGTARFVKQ